MLNSIDYEIIELIKQNKDTETYIKNVKQLKTLSFYKLTEYLFSLKRLENSNKITFIDFLTYNVIIKDIIKEKQLNNDIKHISFNVLNSMQWIFSDIKDLDLIFDSENLVLSILTDTKKQIADNLNLKCIYTHYDCECNLCYDCIGDIYKDKKEFKNNCKFDYEHYLIQQDMYHDYCINVLGRNSVY